MIEVVGEHDGREVVRVPLEHGADPETVLAGLGWTGRVVSVVRPATGDLTMTYAVSPRPDAPPGPSRATSHEATRDARDVARDAQGTPRDGPPADPGLTASERAGAHRHQRVAAYAVVSSTRGWLLTQLSERTNAAGSWNLPGGGLEPDEDPVDGVRREVWEESGQVITDVRLLMVLTQHWVGRAPDGRVEDFQAVRVIHTAHCPDPSDPVVHDVGGSTAQARWVPGDRLNELPLVGSAPDALRAAGAEPVEHAPGHQRSG